MSPAKNKSPETPRENPREVKLSPTETASIGALRGMYETKIATAERLAKDLKEEGNQEIADKKIALLQQKLALVEQIEKTTSLAA